MNHGNQHASPRVKLLHVLEVARGDLRAARFCTDPLRSQFVAQARAALQLFRAGYAAAPASTQRRWRCGR
jgi:hypothetical protein